MTRRRLQDEKGAAAPLAVTITGLLLMLTLLAGGLGRLVVDQRRASSAADLAALAGAGALQHGADPCAAARATALRNQAALIGCEVAGERVEVRAAVESDALSGVLGLLGHASVEARAVAGPVT